MDLIAGQYAPFCSIECGPTVFNGCDPDKVFFPEGCTLCKEGGAAPVNGACPAPGGVAYNIGMNTLAKGNDQFLTNKNVVAASIKQIDSPDAGAVVLSKNLTTVKDPENTTAHIIGAVILASALAAFCCCLIICCWRRRNKEKKKKEESEMMDENMN
jgi:hypothetical protein